jgi:hypothetical protein
LSLSQGPFKCLASVVVCFHYQPYGQAATPANPFPRITLSTTATPTSLCTPAPAKRRPRTTLLITTPLSAHHTPARMPEEDREQRRREQAQDPDDADDDDDDDARPDPSEHFFPSAPNASLCRALLRLSSSSSAPAAAVVHAVAVAERLLRRHLTADRAGAGEFKEPIINP